MGGFIAYPKKYPSSASTKSKGIISVPIVTMDQKFSASTVSIKDLFQSQYLNLDFYIPASVGKLDLFIHNEGLEATGLAINYWTKQPFAFQFEPDHTYNFEIAKQTMILDKQRKCDYYGDFRDHRDCIIEEIRRNNCTKCFTPFLKPFMLDVWNEGFRYCSTLQEVRDAESCISKTIGAARDEKCFYPCR